ncbi:4-amino-4-deoxy-L-arabinose transferase-like glycosyltransferase [Chitinivorax tropicus]|uniref:4-amino-4-deoxy-L-arabinose transferase-like glycosyltransferase n=1 Tax=Chitinivorax tropicus TaxID=714531 RepID=A0A840MPA4_9PROT|nr:glycosyltransferase family 39 protein [Chitinivorax tropicus]MBB5017081.1 4-amino-4-deoxy-L-arabinose transferase-like glycosyltransferase [Chitinivorax tropicus]
MATSMTIESWEDQSFAQRAISYAVFLLPIIYLFFGIDQYALLNENEGRYAEIAREMLASGNFIIPHLNGLPYLEKPPLLYYLTTLSFSLFGVNDIAARLVPISASLLAVGTLAWFGRAVGRPLAGLIAAFVLGSSLGFVLLGNVQMTDSLYNALWSSALLVAYVGLTRPSSKLMAISYALLALAVLAKGLVTLVLFYMVLFPLAWLSRDVTPSQWLKRLFAPWPIVVFAVIAVPWHIAAALSLKEFSWFYFINEHVYRFTGQRMPKDYYAGGTPLFYVPRLIFLFFPWSIIMLIALIKRQITIDQTDRRLTWFAWLLAGIPTAFFAISSSKADYYVMVALPGIALVLAQSLARNWQRSQTFILSSIILCVFGAAFGAWQSWIFAPEGLSSFMPWQLLPSSPVALAWSVLGGAAALLFWLKRPLFAWLAIGLMFLPLKITLVDALQAKEPHVSAQNLAGYIKRHHSTVPVMLYRDYELLSSLPFHLEQTIPVVDSVSPDLWFGQQLGTVPSQFPLSTDLIQSNRGFLLVVPDRRLQEMAASPLAPKLSLVTQIGDARLYRFTP